jgi:hypothetical protein
MLTQANDTLAGEDAKDGPLVLGEFWGRVSKPSPSEGTRKLTTRSRAGVMLQILSQECLDPG